MLIDMIFGVEYSTPGRYSDSQPRLYDTCKVRHISCSELRVSLLASVSVRFHLSCHAVGMYTCNSKVAPESFTTTLCTTFSKAIVTTFGADLCTSYITALVTNLYKPCALTVTTSAIPTVYKSTAKHYHSPASNNQLRDLLADALMDATTDNLTGKHTVELRALLTAPLTDPRRVELTNILLDTYAQSSTNCCTQSRT
jgi:hypothetical protein